MSISKVITEFSAFLFFFLHPCCNCFLFLPSDKNAWVSLGIFTTENMLTFAKWPSCYFIHSLIESLKIFTWAPNFQITFSLWLNFVRKIQNLYIRIFLPLESVQKFSFLENSGEFLDVVHQGLPLSFAFFLGFLSPSVVDLGHRASNGLEEPQLSSQGG